MLILSETDTSCSLHDGQIRYFENIECESEAYIHLCLEDKVNSRVF